MGGSPKDATDPPAPPIEMPSESRAPKLPMAQAEAPPPESDASREPDAERREPSAADYDAKLLMPRWTMYVQAGVMLLLAVSSFAAGYFIGRGDAVLERRTAQQQAARERTLVEGRVTYQVSPETVAPDEDAVVLLLPSGVRVSQPMAVYGIRAQDDPPRPTHESVRTIEELQGAYLRTDDDGRFRAVLPSQGEYLVLVISAHATRPPGEPPHADDVRRLDPLVTMPERLISHFQYRLEDRELTNGSPPIEVHFPLESQWQSESGGSRPGIDDQRDGPRG